MKKLLLKCQFVITTVCLTVEFSSAQTQLFDNFNGSVIDTNKWTVTEPTPTSTVTQTNNTLVLSNGGSIRTVESLTQPYRLTLSNVSLSGGEVFAIHLRTTGQVTLSSPYNYIVGINMNIWAPNSTAQLNYVDSNGDNSLLQAPTLFTLLPTNKIVLIDEITSITLEINDLPVWTSFTSISDGDKLAFSDRQDSPDSTSIGSVSVETVPEPSTYALLLLSGAASLWALRRRKS